MVPLFVSAVVCGVPSLRVVCVVLWLCGVWLAREADVCVCVSLCVCTCGVVLRVYVLSVCMSVCRNGSMAMPRLASSARARLSAGALAETRFRPWRLALLASSSCTAASSLPSSAAGDNSTLDLGKPQILCWSASAAAASCVRSRRTSPSETHHQAVSYRQPNRRRDQLQQPT